MKTNQKAILLQSLSKELTQKRTLLSNADEIQESILLSEIEVLKQEIYELASHSSYVRFIGTPSATTQILNQY